MAVRFTTVHALRDRYADDRAHSEHVASNALFLFDRTHERLGISRAERRLLEYAALLHDIGFGKRPGSHACESERLVRVNRFRALSSGARDCVAQVVGLHTGKGLARILEKGGAGLAAERRVLRLCAYLRIADGLDHGHIQDARVVDVREAGGRFEVIIDPGSYVGTLDSARRKCDTWNRTFSLPVELVCWRGWTAEAVPRFLVAEADLWQTARRLLWLQYRALCDNLDGVAERADVVAVHEFRVAARRMKALLRLFARVPGMPRAEKLLYGLGVLCDRLADLRDNHVWLKILGEFAAGSSSRDRSFFSRLNAREVRACRKLERDAIAFARGGQPAAVLRLARKLLRVQMARTPEKAVGLLFGEFAGGKLRRCVKALARDHELSASLTDEEVHAIRKKVRRARYRAEFCGLAAGKTGRSLAKRLRELATLLGDVHDCDVHVARLARRRGPAAQRCRALLGRRRSAAWEQGMRAWNDMVHGPRLSKVLKRLQDCRKAGGSGPG